MFNIKYLGLVSRTLGPEKDLKDRINWAAKQDGHSFILFQIIIFHEQLIM